MTSSSSDSDSDLENLIILFDRPRRSVNNFKRVNYMQSLDDGEFTFRFRLSKPAVEALLIEIMPYLRVTSARNHGVAPLHQLLLTLRFYSLGTMLVAVGDFIGVSKSTAGRIVQNVSAAIAILYDKYIFINENSANKFYNIAGFPRVLGVIDCTHIRIQCPSLLNGEEFRNRKSYFSLNVQGVCDADLKFMNVVARWPGSAHDATIFNNSFLRSQCDAGQFGNRWLLGDSAYPNRSYLLTPILNPMTEADHKYNTAHIKTRNTIERTFGVWKCRFPVLSLTLRLSLNNINAVIIATAVLHNICRIYNLEDIPSEVDLQMNTDNDEDGFVNIEEVHNTQREELINNYFR